MENLKHHDHMSGKRNAGAQLEEIESILGPAKFATTGAAQAQPDGAQLPEFVFLHEMIANPAPEPELLIGHDDAGKNALVHRGDKVLLGAGSKDGKTWMLLQKALCIAAGAPFLGHKTTKGVVLYINFELRRWSFDKRVLLVAKALGLFDGMKWKNGLVPDLIAWNLRGVKGGYDIENLIEVARERLRRRGLTLAAIVIDPLYKSYGGKEENSATDMAEVFAAIERFGEEFNAAVFIASHFAKGDSAAKAQLDRISGSGVMARDPDSIMTLSKFPDADRCYTFEATLRNMACPEPFVLEFDFPIWRRRPDLAAAGKGYKLEDLAALLPTDPAAGLTANAWFEAAAEQGVCGKKARFLELKDQCISRGLVGMKIGPRNAQICYQKPVTSQTA